MSISIIVNTSSIFIVISDYSRIHSSASDSANREGSETISCVTLLDVNIVAGNIINSKLVLSKVELTQQLVRLRFICTSRQSKFISNVR